jgi:eukaryotic-like serine/threonine-protein kinase
MGASVKTPASVPGGDKGLRDSLPHVLGPYTLFEPIGRGGMAELFLGRSESELGATRLAVVKVIHPAFADDPKFAEMLVHEAKLASSLSHRHIVNVFDLGRDGGRLYIAMEYVEGFDLTALLRACQDRDTTLPVAHALGIVADVLEGLDYAHRKKNDDGTPLGIVHRDVSPSNVLISYDGEVKLCDFGIAKANDLVREEASDALKGKAGYMSPEHACAETLDARADVFAAGIILWELLAGKRLYRPRGDVPLLEQARRAEIPDLPLFCEDLPHGEELQRVLRRALARNREERYPSADAFGRDLEGYLARAGLLASRLKLGEWIARTIGTKLLEQRRASERKLPRSSAPPPRSSGAVRVRTAAAMNVVVPAPPRIPRDLLTRPAPPDLRPEPSPTPWETLPAAAPPSEAAMSLAPPSRPSPPKPAFAAPPAAPLSLAGTTMDIEPSSRNVVDPASGPDTSTTPDARKASDDEVLRWARRRGVVSFFFFFAIALAVALFWTLR